MAKCKTCSKCKKTKCGCEDQALTTNTPCGSGPDCQDSDPCTETTDACCTIYNRDTIVDTDINKGDNLCEILQIMSLWVTNPTCVTPGSTCKSVIGLRSTAITTTAVQLVWSLNDFTPSNIQVEYKLASSPTWTLGPSLAGNILTYTVAGLTANTDYHFRVNSINSPCNCYSVTILVKTNS